MTKPKILAFAGSARRSSYNKQLVRIAAAGALSAGADVTVVDLADYPLPLFNEDLEADQGPPAAAVRLKALSKASDGFLISCPEYNSSITPLLKNTLDWMSRRAEGEPPLAAFQGKACALMSASPGKLGGLRGLVTVRSILGNIGVLLLPDQVAVSQADAAFADDGSLKDGKQQTAVRDLGRKLTELVMRLKAT
jgi:NAD(P)H-dependent FMN reductase